MIQLTPGVVRALALSQDLNSRVDGICVFMSSDFPPCKSKHPLFLKSIQTK